MMYLIHIEDSEGKYMTNHWTFLRADPNEVERNPIHDEFFSASEILTDVSSLVRESIQNSLDAAKEETVVVRFTIGEISGAKVKAYFQGLDKHIQAALTSAHDRTGSTSCKYLIVEDFHTTGLLGDVTASATKVKEAPQNNGYWYFAKANGDSGKGNGTRGTWGVGKVVFPRMSAIKTFFAYSVRSTPSGLSQILFGQSLLKFHNVDNSRFKPDGWWGQRNENGIDVPFGSDQIEQFTDCWRLSRSPNQEGLSIVIPWVDQDLGVEEIFNCVLRDYFVALLQGNLICEFKDTEGIERHIDKGSVISHLQNQYKTDPTWKTVLDLAEIFINWKGGILSEFEIDLAPSNKWQDLKLSDEFITNMISEHDSGKAFAIKTTCKIPGTNAGETFREDSFVTLVAKREVRDRAIFSRSGILIPKANPNRISGSVALVILEPTHSDGHSLSTLLSAAEGPAHENWSKDGDRFKDTYTPKYLAEETLTMVRKAPSEIVRLVSAIADGRDADWLAEYFPMPDGARPNPTPVDPRPGPHKPKIIDPPPSEPTSLRVHKTKGGFSITGDAEDLIGKQATLRVAYELRRGNSQKAYRATDFDLSDLIKTSRGVSITTEDNVIQLSEFEADFRVSFEGFDQLRDLEILSTTAEISEAI